MDAFTRFVNNFLWKSATMTHNRAPYALLLLRLSLGGLFLYTGLTKWADPMFSAKLPSLLLGYAPNAPFFVYEDFLTYIAAPNASMVSRIIIFSELFIGISLLLGFCVRLSTLLGMALMGLYFLATLYQGFPYSALNLLCFSGLLSLFWSRAGQVVGMDQLFSLGQIRRQSSGRPHPTKENRHRTSTPPSTRKRSKGTSPKTRSDVAGSA